MSETNTQKFLNTLWEFTGGKEDKSNFIQKELKVCKIFKVKPLNTKALCSIKEDGIQPVLQRHSKDKKRVSGCSCL